MQNRNIRVLYLFITFATGWRLFFFFDQSFWQRFIAFSGNNPNTAWLFYSIALYVGLLISAWVVHEKNIRVLSVGFMSASLVLFILMRIFPVLQSFYISYALLGSATGVYFATFAYYGGLWVMPEERISFHALIVLGFSIIVYLFIYLFEWLPFDLAFLLLCGVQACAIVLNLRYTLPPPDREIEAQKKIPYRLLMSCALALFIGYFVSYLNQGGASISDFTFVKIGLGFFDLLIRVAACFVVFIFGRHIKINHLIYATNFSYVFALILNLLRLNINLPAFVMYNIAFILGQITFYVFFTAIVYKFGRQPRTYVFLCLCVGMGVIGGQAMGRTLSVFLEQYPLLLFVIALLLSNSVFFILSFLLRSTRNEVDLEREASPGLLVRMPEARPSPESEFESIVLRRRISDALIVLNGHFDTEFQLTKREIQIAAFCVERYDYETIALKLGISLNTLRTHIRNIYSKLDISSRKELAQMLEEHVQNKLIS